MVLEPIPKTAGARPPFFGGPPPGTTFSQEPDDRDQSITRLRDNVKHLIRQSRTSATGELLRYMDLLNRRRNWVEREMGIERMLLSPPAAPLGIPENAYDLVSLSEVGGREELRIYHQMLNEIEAAMEDLWRRWMAAAEAES